MSEINGTPQVIAAPAVVVVAPPSPSSVNSYPSSVPPAPVIMKQDPAITREIRRVNWLLFSFAIIHFIGVVLFLAGNCAALNGPYVANRKYRDGLRVIISGACVMTVASLVLLTAHIMDLIRSRKLGISNFLVYSSLLVSITFVVGFLLWAIGFGVLLRAWHFFNDGNFNQSNRKRADGLIIITVGTFIAAFGIFIPFVLHWSALEARSRNRVAAHTFSPSHLRSWAMSAGNFDFMIGWVIYVVAALAAAVNAVSFAQIAFQYQLFIVGIITSGFFLLGDFRTIYLTWPSRALYTDMIPFGTPVVLAEPYGQHSVHSAPITTPVVPATAV